MTGMEQEANSLNDEKDISLPHAVSLSQSASNDDDLLMDTADSHEQPSHEPPEPPPAAAAMSGIKQVPMPSFRIMSAMKDGEDHSDNDSDTGREPRRRLQQQHYHMTMAEQPPFTQQNPDEEDDSDDNDSRVYGVDDDEEDGSDNESESDEEESTQMSPERTPIFGTEATRAWRQQRNKDELARLGLKGRSPQRTKHSHNKEEDDAWMASPSEPPTPRPQPQLVRGMVFATPYNTALLSSSSLPAAAALLDEKNYDEEDAEAAMLEELEELYPHRQAQINQLWSLLSPALPPTTTSMSSSSMNASNMYNATQTATATQNIPPPLFVTGPAGTGKTSLVRDVVRRLQQFRSSIVYATPTAPRVGSAYINCATLDSNNNNKGSSSSSPMEELLHEAYRQLAHDMKAGRNHATTMDDLWRRRRKRKRKTPKKVSTSLACSTPQEAGTMDSSDRNKKQRCETGEGNVSKDVSLNLSSKAEAEGEVNSNNIESTKEALGAPDTDQSPTSAGGKSTLVLPSDPSVVKVGGKEKEDENDESPKLRRSRRVSELADTGDGNITNANEQSNTSKNNKNNNNPKAKKLMNAISSDLDATTIAAAKEGDLTTVATAASRTAHIAAATFGQEIKDALFSHANDCAFLVLDQAEQLLSSPSSSASAKTNFLAQLLLLPRTKGLNLTIIVITKSIVLEHSRKLWCA